jgi:hypothetical protein
MITMSCAWHCSSFLHRRRDFANSLDGKGDMASVRTDTAAAGDTKVVRGPCCETKRGGEEVTLSRSRGGREERKCCISRGTEYNNTLLKSSSSENSCGGPAEAARFARNDAMLVCAAAHNLDERARNDISLLSQYFFFFFSFFLILLLYLPMACIMLSLSLSHTQCKQIRYLSCSNCWLNILPS